MRVWLRDIMRRHTRRLMTKQSLWVANEPTRQQLASYKRQPVEVNKTELIYCTKKYVLYVDELFLAWQNCSEQKNTQSPLKKATCKFPMVLCLATIFVINGDHQWWSILKTGGAYHFVRKKSASFLNSLYFTFCWKWAPSTSNCFFEFLQH